MATRREANIVYAAGLVHGIELVTFPAASTVFTDPGEYDPVEHPVRDDVPAAGSRGHHIARPSSTTIAAET